MQNHYNHHPLQILEKKSNQNKTTQQSENSMSSTQSNCKEKQRINNPNDKDRDNQSYQYLSVHRQLQQTDRSESGIYLQSYIEEGNDSSFTSQEEQQQLGRDQDSAESQQDQQNDHYQSRIQLMDDDDHLNQQNKNQDQEDLVIEFIMPQNNNGEKEINVEQKLSNESGGKQKQLVINDDGPNTNVMLKHGQQDRSYNDTLSYLEDMLGATCLENLAKQTEHIQLPPKIQCTAAYIPKPQSNSQKNSITQYKNQIQQIQSKTYHNTIKQFAKKQAQFSNQISPKLSHPKNLQSQVQKPLKKKITTDHHKLTDLNGRNYPIINKHAPINKPILTLESQKHQQSVKSTLNQKQTHLKYKKFLEDQPINQNKKDFKQIKLKDIKDKEYKKNKKVYIDKQLKSKYREVNGWLYPDRGNVMYDQKVRPWVLEGQLTQQEQYYQDLIKRQYITQLQRESLESYLLRVYNHFVPPPYMSPFGMTDHTGMIYYDHSAMSYPYQPYHPQQPYMNYPPHMIAQNYTQTASENLRKNISSFLLNNNSGMQHSNTAISTKTTPKRETINCNLANDRSQTHQQPSIRKENHVIVPNKQHSHKNYPQKYQKVLPSNILQTSKSSPPVAIIKQMSKPDNKSQVYVIYDVPIIVSNENISSVSADVFFLPYCKALLVDKCPTKWMKCLQKMTGINILEKIQLMNQKEIKLKGQQIPEGTLNRIRINENSSNKLNFNTLYLAKLTTLVDEGSKNPFGQRLFREVIDKVIQSLVNDIRSQSFRNKIQSSLLIHGGFVPGLRRIDTPRLICSFLSLSLANASLEYKRTGAKPKKIIINVPKQQQYEVYNKQMRKVLLEYRKVQNF